MDVELLMLILIGLFGLFYALMIVSRIKKKKIENDKVKEIAGLIKSGAKSYLSKQYKILSIVAIFVSIVLGFALNFKTSLAFIFGAMLSATAGYIGMMVATTANARTTEGCRESLNSGLKIAFSSGVVMGLIVVCLGLLGIILSYLIFKDVSILFGFGFGASFIALFARVGGGIYTKAADVGADLVGKVEEGIPEDDPRNPAVIADNVGDNVGDVAGMGADLFESYVQSIIAAIALGLVFFATLGNKGLFFPMMIAGLGIIASIIGTFFVKAKKEQNAQGALNKGVIVASIFSILFSFLATWFYLGPEYLNVFYAIVVGAVSGIAVGFVTEYYTSADRKPVKSIAHASETGPATNIIKGLSVGMMSTAIPVIIIVVAIILAFNLAGLFGIAIAAIGMLSTLGITLATDTYGPVADNAAGIAEMSGLKGETRHRAESLDAVGNTTAAIGKGFAIGSAALTALALFSVFGQTASLETLDILKPAVLAGVFIGALLPFVFSSFAMDAVGKAALSMVKEVRKQFQNNKELLKPNSTAKPDYDTPIQISTASALKQMILPGVLAIATPIVIGLIFGAEGLGGLLAGTTVTGLLLAMFLSNAGGAWDNAKKFIEAGNLGGKGSAPHKAAVIGDTVGDPAKDTAGPSLNILIKIVSIVALLFVTVIATKA